MCSSRRHSWLQLSFLAVFAMFLLPVSSVQAEPNSGYWSENFRMDTGLEGTARAVNAIVPWNGDQVICGRFETVNGVAASNIALMIEPESGIFTFKPLGTGVDGIVFAAAEYKGDLIVVGNFDTAGGVSVQNMARWDGTAWHAMPGNETGGFTTLLVHDDLLLAAGYFTSGLNFVKQWNGSQWSQYGPYIYFDQPVQVRDLIVYGGELHACGQFNDSLHPELRNIVVLHDGNWVAVGDNIDTIASAHLNSMALHQGDLIVGGLFTYGDDFLRGNIVRWDGSNWHTMGDGLGSFGTQVHAVYSSGSTLFAGGIFDIDTTDGTCFNLAMWNGGSGSWQTPDGTGGQVYGTVTCLGGREWESALYIGGDFDEIDGRQMNRLAHYEWSNDWGAMNQLGLYGDGVIRSVRAMTTYQGDLVAANPWQAGDIAARGIARWNGDHWDGFGGGLDPETEWGTTTVHAVTEHDGMLVAGGFFNAPDGGDHNLAAWNGSHWLSLGAEIFLLHPVSALISYGGDLVVGGAFDQMTGSVGDHIMRFDGESWHSMGGLHSYYSVEVNDLCEYGGDLYIGGRFSQAGGYPALNIARWDGYDLQPVGNGVPGQAFTLAVYDGQLLAGTLEGIFAWDGVSWTAFPRESDLPVRSLAVMGDNLYAARADFWGESLIELWDGGQWWPLAEGVAGMDFALQPYNGGLYLGGAFEGVEGVNSFGIACWRPDLTAAPDGAVTGAWLAPSYPNPFNPSTTITFSLASVGAVRLSIHDINGRLVRTILDGAVAAGEHQAVWDGRDDDGGLVPSGVYLSRLSGRQGVRAGKLVLSK